MSHLAWLCFGAGSGRRSALQVVDVPGFSEVQGRAFSHAALATTLGGLDGIVFTAGIGEHQPTIRATICERLAWLGVALDHEANAANAERISTPESRVAVLVIPTDEEQ